ncbi:endolysin [Aquamicrobium phage P14]|uniref:Endolysin n=1 Tax=Aquamicrobium phage P14 TaxID=1927013 RepID=A0A1L5C033_9CAUD|nr:endolysin [Aquamicrobium phage P14]APL99459.1 putative lysozyme [Aquamicrobium phage P14]
MSTPYRLDKRLVASVLAAAVGIATPFLKDEESLPVDKKGVPLVYIDPVGVRTFCYGQTGPLPVQKLTVELCADLLDKEVDRIGNLILGLVQVPLAPHQLAALISFTYNVGDGAFRSSTLLRKLNAGDYKGAAAQFDRWKYAGKRDCTIRINNCSRRMKEKALFLGKGLPYDPLNQDHRGPDPFLRPSRMVRVTFTHRFAGKP